MTYSIAESESNQFDIKAGAMYRHKNRENFYNNYSLSPMLINGQPQVFTTIDAAQWEFRPVEGGYGSPVNQNDYTVTENVLGYYADLKATLNEKFTALAGVRFELTDLNYLTPMPESFVGRLGSQSYMDILPGIHLKYSLTQKQNLRLSYFKSISRPSFFEVIPYQLPGDYFDEIGNPYLKRATAQNADLRYELFPKPTDQFLVGVFYKKITNPIEYAFVRGGSSALYLQPQNFGVATNYGFEMVLIKYLKNFGVSLNYTYTKSQTTTNKQNYYLDAERNIVSDHKDQTRPLQGQADHIGNLSLLYKNPKIGLDMQLSAVYTGELISQVSPYYGLDYWAFPMTTVDLSCEKIINKKKNLTLFVKAKNLLNAKAETRIKQENTYYSGTFQLPEQNDPHTILVKKEEYRPSYLIGIRYSL
jgi:TonB-dependent receptor